MRKSLYAILAVVLLCVAAHAYSTFIAARKLGYAAQIGDVAAVQKILDTGLKPDSDTGKGMTALDWAVWDGHLSVVQILLDRGADPTRDLVRAENRYRTPILKMLLAHGANAKSKDGSYALIAAVENGRPADVALMLRYGANPNAVDEQKAGKTVLAIAVSHGTDPPFVHIAKLLKAAGATQRKQR